MKKYMLILMVLLVLPLVLAACGDDLSAEDAEKGLKAAMEGDRDEAENYICDEELDELDSSMAGVESEALEGVGYSFDCEKDGDDMKCDMTISMGEGEDAFTDEQTVTFNIEDGKLCGEAN